MPSSIGVTPVELFPVIPPEPEGSEFWLTEPIRSAINAAYSNVVGDCTITYLRMNGLRPRTNLSRASASEQSVTCTNRRL